MIKKAIELLKGDKIIIIGRVWIITSIEVSDIGKQGTKKCRFELESNGEKMAIIRPADYPFNLSS